MKVHVLYDKQGKVVSVGVPLPRTDDFRGPEFGTQPNEGQYAGEFEVPEEHAQTGLVHFADKMKIDVQGKSHKLVSK
jgi:hypothetical protein